MQRDNPDARVSGLIIDAAMAVHSTLGPGLLESAYQACLAHELALGGLLVQPQLPLAIEYRGISLEWATGWIYSWSNR